MGKDQDKMGGTVRTCHDGMVDPSLALYREDEDGWMGGMGWAEGRRWGFGSGFCEIQPRVSKFWISEDQTEQNRTMWDRRGDEEQDG